MPRVKCERCGDPAGFVGKGITSTNSTWWARNPADEKVPVCGYCWSQMQNKHKWQDEPVHKYMERMGIK